MVVLNVFSPSCRVEARINGKRSQSKIVRESLTPRKKVRSLPRMTLKEWKNLPTTEGWTVQRLADACGVLKPTVYAWLDGSNLPTMENFAVLERISEGRVKVSSLVAVHRQYETDRALRNPKGKGRWPHRRGTSDTNDRTL